jgi:hypothetical protein
MMDRDRMMSEIREICSLSDEEISTRSAELRDGGFFARVRGREKLDDGLALRFDDTPENREAVEEFAVFERKCCSGLDFAIREKPDALLLEIRGLDPESSIFSEQAKTTTTR